jgi:large subunit ribosomal protein L54
MLCRTCLRRAAAMRPRLLPIQRPFSISLTRRDEAAAPVEPVLTDPAADVAGKPALSVCAKGTVLNGLNYFKTRQDPLAMADEDYPPWLWDLAKIMEKESTDALSNVGDEFCTPLLRYPSFLVGD